MLPLVARWRRGHHKKSKHLHPGQALPIESTPVSDADFVRFDWSILDEDELSRLLAFLTLGHFNHVERILNELGGGPTLARKPAIQRAIDELSKTTGKNLYNRDGWVFQFISWIVLRRRTGTDVILDAPHPQTTSKGFDGLAVSFDESTWSTKFILLTEDKATNGPRGKFTSQIEPELKDIEGGSRNSQLMSQLTSLAKQRTLDQNNLEHLLETAFYDSVVRYRVCIATSRKKIPKPSQTQIIDGFSTTIQGDRKRRGSELLVFDDLRDSLQRIVDHAIAHLYSMAEELE